VNFRHTPGGSGSPIIYRRCRQRSHEKPCKPTSECRDILDDVSLVAHRADRLQSMLETDHHTIATVTESVLLHVHSGHFLAIANG
jgi:hypothetical protein